MSFTMEKSASRIHATAKDLRFVRGLSVFECVKALKDAGIEPVVAIRALRYGAGFGAIEVINAAMSEDGMGLSEDEVAKYAQKGFRLDEGFLEIFMQKAKELRDSDVSGK